MRSARSRLHRIEASCLPHNEASLRLLSASASQREGYARAYLRINGAWQDHLLYALLETDRTPPPARREGAEAMAQSNRLLGPEAVSKPTLNDP